MPVTSDGANRSAALACRLWILRSRRLLRGPQSSPSSASLCALHPWAPQRVTGATSSLLGLYMEVSSTVSSSARAHFAATPPQLGEVSPYSTLKHVQPTEILLSWWYNSTDSEPALLLASVWHACHAGFCLTCYHTGLPSLCYHKATTATAALCMFDLRASLSMVSNLGCLPVCLSVCLRMVCIPC